MPETEPVPLAWSGDQDYGGGGWYRCQLIDGSVVYIGGCGECGTPWLEYQKPEGTSFTPVDATAAAG